MQLIEKSPIELAPRIEHTGANYGAMREHNGTWFYRGAPDNA